MNPGVAAALPPLGERTLVRAVGSTVSAYPERTAVRDDHASLTYAELWDLASRIGGSLLELGCRPGDAVLHMLDNSADHAATCIGIALAGLVSVPVNTHLIGDLLAHVVNDCGASVIVVESRYLPAVDAVASRFSRPLTFVVRGRDTGAGPRTATRWQDVAGHEGCAVADVAPWDIQAIMYTSGTTGDSKGVVVSHAQTYTRAAVVDLRDPAGASDIEVALVTLPLYHVVGQCRGMFSALFTGGTAVLAPRFSVHSFWSTAASCGATYTSLLGAMASYLLRAPPSLLDRGHQLHTVVMAPTIPRFREFSERFGVRILTSYGSTELGSVTVGEASDESVGRVHAEFEAKIVDHQDLPVPEGEAGELVVRAREPWVITSGYLGRPEASLVAWRNGWFHTGDTFRRAPDGRLHFAGRQKDTIRRRGENISAAELERAVLAHPGVAECAAVGVPSEDSEEEVKVVVVPAREERFDEAELVAFLADRVPSYMVPRYVDVVAALPVTPTNKIDKKAIRTDRSDWDAERLAPEPAGPVSRRDQTVKEPRMTALAGASRFYREQVVVSARVLGHEGYGDLTMGHVSVLDRESGLMYIKRKGIALSECNRDDVLVHPVDDDAGLQSVRDMHFEAIMHSATYRARPDVNAVIHSHPPYGVALGVTDAEFAFLAHDSIMFAEHGVPALDNPALVTTPELAGEVTEALGQSRALLLRGHGVMIAGEDIRWATRAALALERAIKIQSIATTLGNLRPLSPENARALYPRKYTAKSFVQRPGHEDEDKTSLTEFWDLWERIARRTDGGPVFQV